MYSYVATHIYMISLLGLSHLSSTELHKGRPTYPKSEIMGS